MTARLKTGATYDDVVNAPEFQIAELVEGDLYMSPRPAPRHANATSVLLSRLNDAFQQGRSGPGGWWVWYEPELHLLGDVLVPDIAAWRRSRLPEMPDGTGIDLYPDWVCEVLSPSTRTFDRRQKLPRYALAQIGHLWLVDPEKRLVEVYSRSGVEWQQVGARSGADSIVAPPFETLSVDLASLWG